MYANIEFFIKKVDGCPKNPKIGEQIPCGNSMSAIWALGSIDSKHTLCCGEYYMKRFCESLRKLAKI